MLSFMRVEIIIHFGKNPNRGGSPPRLNKMIIIMINVEELLESKEERVLFSRVLFNIKIDIKVIEMVTYVIK